MLDKQAIIFYNNGTKDCRLKHNTQWILHKSTFFLTSQDTVKLAAHASLYADVAQLVEQLICNQPVVGSSPTIGSRHKRNNMGEFQSGQMGQTVNLLAKPSEVRILPLPLFAEVAHLAERQPSKL